MFALTARFTLGRDWYRPTVLLANGKGLLVTTAATVGGLLLILVLVFFASIPVAVYQDHMDLAAATTRLVREKRDLQRQLDNERARPKTQEAPKPAQRATSARPERLSPTFAIEVVQEFSKLAKPCLVRLRASTETAAQHLRSDLRWILTYGAGCSVDESVQPINVDAATEPPPNKSRGLIIRWHEGFEPGAHIARVFDDDGGLVVKISHQMPPTAAANLIWIDIGPGSPWK